MLKCESIMQVFDIAATVVIFIVAGLLGKISINCYGDTWLAFNVPTFAAIIIGEFMWIIIRRFIKRLLSKKYDKN